VEFLRSKWRSLLLRAALVVIGLAVASMAVERVLEIRDESRLTVDQTYLTIHGRRVRYRRTGDGQPGPTIVLISGLVGGLDPWDTIQNSLSTESPTISYDRGGLGFSDLSDAHDANAQAEQLDAVLRGAGARPPFVVVSYSATSFLAEVYAAAHEDSVKAIVLVDPTVPRDRRSKWLSIVRTNLRWMVTSSAYALVGWLRLKMLLGDHFQHRAPRTLAEERQERSLVDFHHWLAADQELFAIDRSAEEARALPPITDIPVGVLSTIDPAESEHKRYVFAGQRELAARSSGGIYRYIGPLDHTKLLEIPSSCAAILELVRDVRNEVRGVPTTTAR
jgi:pimeloyl-ACP methyl ester carboxylesterase